MKKIISLALVLALLASLVGCGGEKTESSENKLAQGVTEKEIVVGNCAATSGALAGVGVPFNAGIEAYFNMVNESGGIQGRTIKFVHEDDEFLPDKGKAAVQKMIQDTKVFALVGHFGTPTIAATVDMLKETGIPAVYFASGYRELFTEKAEADHRGLFPVQPILITEGKIMVARASGDFGAKKLGVLYTNDDAGKDMLEGIEAMAKELELEIVKEQIVVGNTDVSVAVNKVLDSKPDMIIAASIQGSLPTIVSALVAQGNEAPVITSYNNADPKIASMIFDTIGGKFEMYANGWLDLSTEESQKAFQEFQEWVGKIDENYKGSAFAMAGWIAGHFFVEGLKAVGDKPLTWANYIDALENADVSIPFGGKVVFKDGKRMGTTSMNLNVLKSANEWAPYKPLQMIEEIIKK